MSIQTSDQVELRQLRNLTERLKLEAQIHAQEARTANATIAEIYAAVTQHTGEPGNWHGAKPVIAELERLRAVAKRYEYLSRQFSPFGLNIDGRHPWVWRGNPDRLRGPNLSAAIDAAMSEQAMQELSMGDEHE